MLNPFNRPPPDPDPEQDFGDAYVGDGHYHPIYELRWIAFIVALFFGAVWWVA